MPRQTENFNGDAVWVVTEPTPDSTLADIMFRVDAEGMIRQVLGGLAINDRPRFYVTEDGAREAAESLLANRDSRDPNCDTSLDRDARNADALHNRPEEL